MSGITVTSAGWTREFNGHGVMEELAVDSCGRMGARGCLQVPPSTFFSLAPQKKVRKNIKDGGND